MKKPDDLVTFAVFEDAVSAYIIKGVLDTNGIESAVADELMSVILPLNMSVNRVRLLVRRCDLEAARRIVAENRSGETEDFDKNEEYEK